MVYGFEGVCAGLSDDTCKVNESVTSFEKTVQALAGDNVARVIVKPLWWRIGWDMPRKNIYKMLSLEEFAYNSFSNKTGAAGNRNKDGELLSSRTKL
jgi:hypothetical protein